MHYKGIFAIIVAAIFTFGCAASPASHLPTRSFQELKGNTKAQVIRSFDYDLSIVFNDDEPQMDISGYKKTLEAVFMKTALFEKMAYGQGIEEYHFSFMPTARYSKAGLIAAASASAVTLFLVPTTVPVAYGLRVELRQNGNLLKEYSYQESRMIWFHITSLDQKGRLEEDRNTIESILLNLLADLRRDGYI